MEKGEEQYDVFISYRRDGGSEKAKHLRDALTARQYRVFLDVNSLGSGPFDEQLYRKIENSTDFLLIHSSHALERCKDESDWVRKEIERAKKCGKNIVPIFYKDDKEPHKDAPFPETLPRSIEFIRTMNGPHETSIEYYDAFVDRIEKMLKSRPHPWWKPWLVVALAIVLLCAFSVGGYLHFSVYPHNRTQENLVSELISYMTLNLSKANAAIATYQQDMERSLRYVEGKTAASAQEALDIRKELSNHSETLQDTAASVTSLPDALREQLMSSPFDVGELDAFSSVLADMIAEYVADMEDMRDFWIPNQEVRDAFKATTIRFFQARAELDAEWLFYTLNETLLPITNEKALSDLKSKYLPELTALFAGRLSLSHDEVAVQGKGEAVYQQLKALYAQYKRSFEREKEYAQEQNFESAVKAMLEIGTRIDLDTSNLEATWGRIEQEKREIEKMEEEILDIEAEIADKRKEAAEKFKPLESDSVSTLWGKGTRFLTMNMPRNAAECFALCAQKGDETYQAAAVVAQKFSENCTALKITGGVIVCAYEENLPHQAVEVGDILYEVDAAPIHNWTEYTAAIKEDGVYAVSILRFTPAGYELLESVIDKSLGRLYTLTLNDEPV